MKTVMVVYGRSGDAVMAMAAAGMAAERDGIPPDIVLHSSYSSVYDVFLAMGMPVGTLIREKSHCPVLDRAVSGASTSRWSDSMIRHRFGKYDKVYNCSPRNFPAKCTFPGFLCYLAGLTDSCNTEPTFPVPSEEFRWVGGGTNVGYHFGSSSMARKLEFEGDPYPDYTSVCFGGPEDPCPSWIKVDYRGEKLVNCVRTMASMRSFIGSDSLFTHISGLMSIPTVCIHTTDIGLVTHSRSMYPNGDSMLCDTGVVPLDDVICRCGDLEIITTSRE